MSTTNAVRPGTLVPMDNTSRPVYSYLASPYTPGVYIFKNKVKPKKAGKKETIMPKGIRSDVSKEDFVNLKEKFQLLG